MKKYILLLVSVIGITGLSKGQFSIGASGGTYIGGEASWLGWNANLNYKFGNSRVGLYLGEWGESTSSETFFGKIESYSYFMPLGLTYQYDIKVSEKFVPYVGAEIGTYLLGVTVTMDGQEADANQQFTGGAAALGARYYLSEHFNLNLGSKLIFFSGENGESGDGFNLQLGVEYVF